MQGGADDQLFRGRRVTPVIEAAVSIITEAGRDDYQFALVWSQGDRFTSHKRVSCECPGIVHETATPPGWGSAARTPKPKLARPRIRRQGH